MHPTFLIIGTAKAATTSLFYYIGQHPQVFLSPVKEPRFFHFEDRVLPTVGPGDEWSNRNTVRTWEDYLSLFEDTGAAIASGEASPVYLYSPYAAINIKKRVPEVKLIVILRDPSERAFSHYLHLRRDGRESCVHFSEALLKEAERIEQGWEWSWHYRLLGFYNEQLDRYAKQYASEQIRVYLYEDLINQTKTTVQDVFDFIGVDASFEPDTHTLMNPGGLPSNQQLFRIANRYDHPIRRVLRPFLSERLRTRLLAQVRRKAMARPILEAEVRSDLIRGYRDDIERLQERIDRDLSAWMS